jgi:hypothetical protein
MGVSDLVKTADAGDDRPTARHPSLYAREIEHVAEKDEPDPTGAVQLLGEVLDETRERDRSVELIGCSMRVARQMDVTDEDEDLATRACYVVILRGVAILRCSLALEVCSPSALALATRFCARRLEVVAGAPLSRSARPHWWRTHPR